MIQKFGAFYICKKDGNQKKVKRMIDSTNKNSDYPKAKSGSSKRNQKQTQSSPDETKKTV